MEKVVSLKNDANELFNAGRYGESLTMYNDALDICRDQPTTCALHKNMAATYLKLKKNEEAVRHCDKALEISPQDPKTLYRRATALEYLERYEEAYLDAQKALLSSPGEASIFQPMLSRLHEIVEERKSRFSKTNEKASRMVKLAFESAGSATQEEIESAQNNVLVLCRERAGIQAVMELNLLEKLKKLLTTKKPTIQEMAGKVTAVRTISEIVHHSPEMCLRVLNDLGIQFLIGLQDLTIPYKQDDKVSENYLNVVQYLWQSIADSLSGVTKKDGKSNAEVMKANKIPIDSFLSTMAARINSRSVQAEARDIVIQFFVKNIDYQALSWGEDFIAHGALEKLLDVGAEVPEFNIESGMELTPNTKNLVSVLLSRVYDNMYYDKAREKYVSTIDQFTKELLTGPELESKIRVTTVLTTLLLGPMDVGNTFIGRQGILEMILVMANSDDYLQQKVASEAIVAAASKKDKARGIIQDGIGILKRLYQSKNDDIKVRALVGLCKLGSTGGTDASWKPFADGSMLKLAEACRRYLLNPGKDISIQRWAIEGISYLTLDADVKEELIDDKVALTALMGLSKHATNMGDVLYPIITTLVNLLNAYDKQEVIPELIQLAKFAKHHIPEEHEFDDNEFVDKRAATLVEYGVGSCLVNLSKASESANILELIARILNAICEKETHRGAIVAQGGARELLRVWQKTTEKGKKLAAQAIARIGITQSPTVSFPGQRSCEVVKPLISLLHVECTALQNFEALLALCNLAGESDTLRKRIWEEQGFMAIENYIYEDHQMLKRAAVQCLLNMCLHENVAKQFEYENDRVKYMMLLCSPPEDLGEDDKDEIELMKAAAGILAILSGGNRVICGKILTNVKNPMEILLWLVANPLVDLQLRGVTVVSNILEVDKEFAEQIVGSPVFEVLLALAQSEIADKDKLTPEELKKKVDVNQRVLKALKFAEKWGLIQKPS